MATRVGQFEGVLDGDAARILVPAGAPRELPDGVITLLRSPEIRRALKGMLKDRVAKVYGRDRAIERISGICEDVLLGGR